MRKTYEYRLRPTPAQERRLVATLDACRFVYNWGIEDRRNLWNYCRVSANFYDQSDYLKSLKSAKRGIHLTQLTTRGSVSAAWKTTRERLPSSSDPSAARRTAALTWSNCGGPKALVAPDAGASVIGP